MTVGTVHTPGTRAVLRHAHFSAYKAREVLDLIRGHAVGDAYAELMLCERGPAEPIAKLLRSAVANAGHNDGVPPEELFVAACFADEGPTMKRFRPRARGRATRIRKRSCHITIIVARFSLDELEARRTSAAQSGRGTEDAAATRARRVAQSRKAKTEDEADTSVDEDTAADADTSAEVDTSADVDTSTEATTADEGAAEDSPAEDSPAEDSAAEATDAGGTDAGDTGAGDTDADADAGAADTQIQPLAASGEAEAAADAPYGPGSHAPLPDNAEPEGYPIKGNADSMLYHLPGGSHYGRTIAEVWFATEEDAQRAGFSPTGSAAKKEED
jgi:large subunit ribosomal protein L22